MSNRYKGAVISATPPTTTGGEEGTASGAWTLEQQMQLQAAGLWPAQPTGPYIEEVFQTWLYTGTGAAQTITNGINLSGKGGLIWTKNRTSAYWHTLFDTVRGNTKVLYSNSTSGQDTLTNTITSFNSTGYTLGVDSNGGNNASGENFVSWTFREQPKFFDVVTWTGDGTNNRLINHSLGSTPGAIIIKRTNTSSNWVFYHRSLFGYGLFLNTTAAEASANSDNGFVSNTTDTQFQVTYGAVSADNVNASGSTYVAYLFAHDAGGFGLTGTDNVITCGSYDGNGSTVSVNLGYEPQFIIAKKYGGTGNWFIEDVMRGSSMTYGSGVGGSLFANLSNAEDTSTYGRLFEPTATGFKVVNGAVTDTMIYIAIRRGPMRVPTVGTTVFAPVNQVGAGTVTTNFPVDLSINTAKSLTIDKYVFSRLIGSTNYSTTNTTDAESTSGSNLILFDRQNSIKDDFWSAANSIIYWNFRRAPSFFDEVCYTGNGATQNVSHNLGVAPELMIVKSRSLSGSDWWVYSAALTTPQNKYLQLQSTGGESTATGLWGSSLPTSTTFGLGAFAPNSGGATFVAYLFATCPGVSKVGSYTGNGTTQTIACGFTGGARFVLIKRTDGSGSWYVYDTARGMTALTDPYLLLNSSAAEAATLGSVTTVSTGFALDAAVLAAINTNAASYIFLAIA